MKQEISVFEKLLRDDLYEMLNRHYREMPPISVLRGGEWKLRKKAWKTPRLVPTNAFRLWAYLHGEDCGSCEC